MGAYFDCHHLAVNCNVWQNVVIVTFSDQSWFTNVLRGFLPKHQFSFCYLTVDATPRRLTPAKFAIPHMKVTFSPGGQIVKVLPNSPADGQPARVEIQEMKETVRNAPETEELIQFPGPLVK